MVLVLKQILKDLRKEWSWAFFYTVVTTMVVVAIMDIFMGFSLLKREMVFANSFIEQNVVMFDSKNVDMKPNEEAAATVKRQQQTPIDIMEYLQNNLSKDGKAGSFVLIANDGEVDPKYKNIWILFGRYSNLAGLEYEGDMAIFVPETHSEDIGKTFTISGHEIECVAGTGENFSMFHPARYMDSINPLYDNALILCTKDFQTVYDMFPRWDLSAEVFVSMVLVNPSDSEIVQLQNLYYKHTGTLYTGVTTEDFARTSTIASFREQRLYILFFILSGVLLATLLICNIIRLIETYATDYTVHHLYGAPIRKIQMRVGGFVLALNIVPIVGVIYKLFSHIRFIKTMNMWYLLPIYITFVAGLCIFAATYVGRRIGTMNSLSNLRRDY